jgi:hypothetical protein
VSVWCTDGTVNRFKFPKKNWLHKTGAPENIPNGIKNMLATLCSKPIVTNVVIGIHNEANLAKLLEVDEDIIIAKFTSQFAKIPFHKRINHGAEVLATAIEIANVAIDP